MAIEREADSTEDGVLVFIFLFFFGSRAEMENRLVAMVGEGEVGTN